MTELEHVAPAAGELAPVDRDRQLSPAAVAAVRRGVADSTQRAYDSDLNEFTGWCAMQSRTAFPATPETITEYVTHLSETPRERTGRPLGPSSIERQLAAIRTAHRLARLAPPETKAAREVLRGYRQHLALTRAPGAKPKRATPAVPEALRAMLGTLDRSTLAGARDAAALLLGYALAARVSELVALSWRDLTETDDGLDVAVYRRKLRRWDDVAVPYGSAPSTCPVRAVRALLRMMAAEERAAAVDPVFVRLDRHGRVAPPMTRYGKPIGDATGRLTAEAAATVIERAADAAGLEGQWSGHSLRRGFATTARRAGHDLERIGRHGGWADGSRALLGYMEDGDRWEKNPVSGL